jgi:hypothetical protein
MGPTRRAICIGLAAWLASGSRHAGGADVLSVTIEVGDSEIITTDLKRIRPAAPAQVRFTVVNDSIASIFRDDLTIPLTRMRLTVLFKARHVLGEKTLAEALGSEAMRAVAAEIDHDLVDLGVVVRDHTLRYVPVPAP